MADSASSRADDLLELRRLRAKYSHRLDAGEWSAWADLFAGEVEASFGLGDPLRGRDAVEEFGRTVLEDQFDRTYHMAHMPVLEFDGPDAATGRWHLHVFYEVPEGTTGWLLGWYDDTYVRVDGEWAFRTVDNQIPIDTSGAVFPDAATDE